MKCLTVKQPFASLVCTPSNDNPLQGIKPIENRTWQTKYRGPLLIHSSAQPAFVGSYKDNLPEGFWSGLTEIERNKLVHSFQFRGAIIGKVDLVDCVINHPSIWAEKTDSAFLYEDPITGKEEPYFAIRPAVKFNWVLENPVLFDEPILNVKGKLSLWEYELPQDLIITTLTDFGCRVEKEV